MWWSRAQATSLNTAPERRRVPTGKAIIIPAEDMAHLERRVAAALHSDMCGWNCPGHGILQPIHDEKYASAAKVAIDVVLMAAVPFIGEKEKQADS